MRKDLITFNKIYSTFFSYPKDIELILKALFVESKPYSDKLKKLLIINNPDCLEDNQDYQKIINNFSLKRLREDGYILFNSKIARTTHQELKVYIIITFDNFTATKNSSHFRDYTIFFDIVCYNDCVELNDYKLRPLEIAGYIDGILNSLTSKNIVNKTLQSQIKLTGIGEYEFLGLSHDLLNQDFIRYSLAYRGKHFSQDIEQINE